MQHVSEGLSDRLRITQFHANERHADYGHGPIASVEGVTFSATVGAEQDQSRRVLLYLICVVKRLQLFGLKEYDGIVARKPFTAIVFAQKVDVVRRQRYTQRRGSAADRRLGRRRIQYPILKQLVRAHSPISSIDFPRSL